MPKMRALWKDITSYSSHGDHVPHWWEAHVGDLRIAIGNNHIYYPDGKTWILHCSPWFDTFPIVGVADEIAAKEAALNLVKEKIVAIWSEFYELAKKG